MSDRIRTTISVPQDVYEVFKQMAEASGVSVSRCMGDWLGETVEGAQHVSMQLQRARELSKKGIKQLHAALKSGESMDEFATEKAARTDGASPAQPARTPPPTPYSNTGLKSPTGHKSRGGKAS